MLNSFHSLFQTATAQIIRVKVGINTVQVELYIWPTTAITSLFNSNTCSVQMWACSVQMWACSGLQHSGADGARWPRSLLYVSPHISTMIWTKNVKFGFIAPSNVATDSVQILGDGASPGFFSPFLLLKNRNREMVTVQKAPYWLQRLHCDHFSWHFSDQQLDRAIWKVQGQGLGWLHRCS